MRLGVIADLHSNLEATRAVFAVLDEIQPDAIVCLGDLAGYNASPNEVIDIIRERRIPCLMGNHDAAASGLEEPWFFNSRAQAALAWQATVLREDNRQWLSKLPAQMRITKECLGVHGAPGNRDEYIMDWLDAMRQVEFLPSKDIRLCFFGHSHHAAFFGERGGERTGGKTGKFALSPQSRHFINPGSVGQPRDQDPRAAFGVFDTESLVFEFHRVEYDIEGAARRIIAAGLPVELASRLFKGK